MQEIPDPQAEYHSHDPERIRRIGRPLYDARTWMQFSGLVLILLGIASVLSIWGILICWIPIWLGVLLIKSASGFETAQASGDEAPLQAAMARLKTVFIILGVMLALELLLIVIGMLVGVGMMMAGLGEL